jgi:hypothetical protein
VDALSAVYFVRELILAFIAFGLLSYLKIVFEQLRYLFFVLLN